MTMIDKGARVTGAARTKLAAELAVKYKAGATVRGLAAETGRSYGAINRILKEVLDELRPKGGARRKPKGAAK